MLNLSKYTEISWLAVICTEYQAVLDYYLKVVCQQASYFDTVVLDARLVVPRKCRVD